MLGKNGAGGERDDRMQWLDSITDSMGMSLSKLGDSQGQGSLVCCSPWGHKESDTTEQLNKNNTQLMNQGAISTFKPYSLRNVFHKATEAIDSDSSHGSEKRQLQTFWREFTSLDAINNLCDSLGRGRNNNINRSLEEVDSTPHG